MSFKAEIRGLAADKLRGLPPVKAVSLLNYINKRLVNHPYSPGTLMTGVRAGEYLVTYGRYDIFFTIDGDAGIVSVLDVVPT